MKHASICILGGTGFLGTRLVARLIKNGHQVTVLSRDREQHKHLLVLPGLTLDNCDVYDEAQLSEQFRGKDVVINLVGILNERGFGGDGFRRTHTELTRGVLQAARSAGVTRLLQVSALKAAVDAPSYYLRSKGEAERLIREHSETVDWTIFQPSVMFGPGDSFLNRFAGLIASIPLVFPLAKPNARFQPVFVDDVIDAMLCCLHGGASSRQTYQLGGPQVYTLREIVGLVAKLTGRPPLDHRVAGFRGAASGAGHGLRSRAALLQRQLSLLDDRQRLHRGRLRAAQAQAAFHGRMRATVSRRAGRQRPLEPRPRRGRSSVNHRFGSPYRRSRADPS